MYNKPTNIHDITRKDTKMEDTEHLVGGGWQRFPFELNAKSIHPMMEETASTIEIDYHGSMSNDECDERQMAKNASNADIGRCAKLSEIRQC